MAYAKGAAVNRMLGAFFFFGLTVQVGVHYSYFWPQALSLDGRGCSAPLATTTSASDPTFGNKWPPFIKKKRAALAHVWYF